MEKFPHWELFQKHYDLELDRNEVMNIHEFVRMTNHLHKMARRLSFSNGIFAFSHQLIVTGAANEIEKEKNKKNY